MSVVDADCAATEDALCAFPDLDLDARVDDEDDPQRLTVLPAGTDDLTTWLTVDADVAVPLSDVR